MRLSHWLACLASALLACSAVAQAPGVAAQKETTIAATGTARVERAPDYVDVMVGKVASESSAAGAHAAAAKTMDAAAAAIKALNLAGADLQTGNVELSPRYEDRNRSDEVPRIIGYQASITLRIRTSDLHAVPKILDAALSVGCNRVDYVQFGIKEALAAREEAIKLATQAARRKAQVIAEGLDLHITRVAEATTASRNNGGWYSGNQISQLSNRFANEAQPAAGDGDDSGVVPGKIEVWADATVTFGAAEK